MGKISPVSKMSPKEFFLLMCFGGVIGGIVGFLFGIPIFITMYFTNETGALIVASVMLILLYFRREYIEKLVKYIADKLNVKRFYGW